MSKITQHKTRYYTLGGQYSPEVIPLSEALVLERENAGLRELLGEVLDGSVDASTYPDGPCLDRSLRAQIKRVLKS